VIDTRLRVALAGVDLVGIDARVVEVDFLERACWGIAARRGPTQHFGDPDHTVALETGMRRGELFGGAAGTAWT